METLEILIRLASPLAILISVSISAFLIIKQIRMNYSMTLRNKSLQYSLYSNEHLRKSRMCIERSFGPLFDIKEPIPMKELLGKSSDDTADSKELIPSIMTLLAHWENMALAIDSNIADEDVCFEMVASTLNQHVKIFRNLIEDRREKNRRIYFHLIELRRRWEEKLSDITISEFQPVLKSKKKKST